MRTLKISLLVFILTISASPQWYQQNSGTMNSLTEVAFIDTNNGIAIGDYGTILKTTNSGNTWTLQSSGTTNYLYGLSLVDLNNGFIVGENQTILKTTDSGITWSLLSPIDSLINLYGVSFTDTITGTAVGFDGNNILGLILRTTDGGNTWTSQSSGTQYTLGKVFFTDANRGVIIGDGGTLLKTTDGGSVWSLYSFGLTYTLSDVFFSDTNNGTIVGTDTAAGAILRTTNGGNSWVAQSSGVNSFLSAVSFADENTGIVVSYECAILKTTDGGTSWSMQSNTLCHLGDVSLINSDYGWAVGAGGTIFHTTNGGVSFIGEESNLFIYNFILSQNYPNPFNPVTKIKFTIPVVETRHASSLQMVTLKIYDLLGREIATLINEEKPAGEYEVEFNATNLPSGIYFYQLKAEQFSETKKMILLK